jgi:hypothetical protein
MPMRFIDIFQKELISLAFALVTAGILYFFRVRAKLVWAVAHEFVFLITPPPPAPVQSGVQPPAPAPINIRTASVILLNSGRAAATDVELTFNWQPEQYNVWPVRPYETHRSPDGRYTLRFSSLSPREQFQIELIGYQLPALLNLRSKECVGRQKTMRPMLVYSREFNATIFVLLFLGLASIFYFIQKLWSLITA